MEEIFEYFANSCFGGRSKNASFGGDKDELLQQQIDIFNTGKPKNSHQILKIIKKDLISLKKWILLIYPNKEPNLSTEEDEGFRHSLCYIWLRWRSLLFVLDIWHKLKTFNWKLSNSHVLYIINKQLYFIDNILLKMDKKLVY